MTMTDPYLPPPLFADDDMRVTLPPMVDSVVGGHSADTRRDDPETSHEARDTTDASASLGAVLGVLREHGSMTDEELVEQMEVAAAWDRVPQFTAQRIRTARAHLTRLGAVEHSGLYRLTVSGRRARVWAVTQ